MTNRFTDEADRLVNGSTGDVAELTRKVFLMGALFLRRQQRSVPTWLESPVQHRELLNQLDEELVACTPVTPEKRKP